MYTEDSGSEYAKNYSVKDKHSYEYRVEAIYQPKAEFLYTSLLEHGVDPHDLSYADLGAGSGYFVAALRKIGLEKVAGYEVSQTQVRIGNLMIGENTIYQHTLGETIHIARTVQAKLVSLIGVLEHLQHPRDMLSALRQNSSVDYLYISVPLFSCTAFFEICFPKVYHMQLGGAHTHLYTPRSLAYMCREFGLQPIAEWWFGTDMVDLYRSIAVSLSQCGCSKKLLQLWHDSLCPVVDSLQLELDKKFMSSEVHMVLRKV